LKKGSNKRKNRILIKWERLFRINKPILKNRLIIRFKVVYRRSGK